MIRIVECPEEFLPKMSVVYPPHQGYNPMIEERAYAYFSSKKELESDYIYLPIQWTSYHINNDYGKNTYNLKQFCSALTEQHPNEKFFTVVQYDGGTLVDIDNCLIFGSSGSFSSPIGKNSIYEPIPLLSDPHDGDPSKTKKYKVGFAGVDKTHPLRVKMCEFLRDLNGYEFYLNSYASDRYIQFREILYNSVFALAPRGFGPASYRMYEAIQMGCIPIYITDEFWLPFTNQIEWSKMSLLIGPDEIETIPEKVDSLIESGEYLNMIKYGRKVYEKYLTWDGCLNTIAERISKC
jgi:hypothetical protein